MERRRSQDRLIPAIAYPILVRWHFILNHSPGGDNTLPGQMLIKICSLVYNELNDLHIFPKSKCLSLDVWLAVS